MRAVGNLILPMAFQTYIVVISRFLTLKQCGCFFATYSETSNSFFKELLKVEYSSIGKGASKYQVRESAIQYLQNFNSGHT